MYCMLVVVTHHPARKAYLSGRSRLARRSHGPGRSRLASPATFPRITLVALQNIHWLAKRIYTLSGTAHNNIVWFDAWSPRWNLILALLPCSFAAWCSVLVLPTKLFSSWSFIIRICFVQIVYIARNIEECFVKAHRGRKGSTISINRNESL